MKFSVLAIAALTTLAAALLVPEDKKSHVIYSPVGAPRHPEHKLPGLGHYGKGKGKYPEVLPSADGDNFKVIKILPDHLKGDRKHDHKPCCPYDKHHPKHDHKHDYKPCPFHKLEHKHEPKPCPYSKHEHEHKHDHKPCPYKHEHKHDHKPCPSEKNDYKDDRKDDRKPEPHRPEHPKPEPPKPEQPPKLEGECSPGTYACTFNPKSGAPGWRVCSSSGKWEYGGDCPPNTVCKYYAPSKSPYCVPRYYEFP